MGIIRLLWVFSEIMNVRCLSHARYSMDVHAVSLLTTLGVALTWSTQHAWKLQPKNGNWLVLVCSRRPGMNLDWDADLLTSDQGPLNENTAIQEDSNPCCPHFHCMNEQEFLKEAYWYRQLLGERRAPNSWRHGRGRNSATYPNIHLKASFNLYLPRLQIELQ